MPTSLAFFHMPFLVVRAEIQSELILSLLFFRVFIKHKMTTDKDHWIVNK